MRMTDKDSLVKEINIKSTNKYRNKILLYYILYFWIDSLNNVMRVLG